MKRIETLQHDVESVLDALFASSSQQPEGDYRQMMLDKLDVLARDCDGRLAVTAHVLTTQPGAGGEPQ